MSNMICAVCHGPFSALEAELGVTTDAGPVHATCFEGPVPEGRAAIELTDDWELLAENERRRDHGDPPLDESELAPLPDGDEDDTQDRGDAVHDGVLAKMRTPDYEGSERLADELERLERDCGGRFDEDGIGY